MITKIQNFLREVKIELSKVSWSTRKELIGATWLVISTTLFFAIIVGVEDLALSKLLRLMLR